MLGAIGVVISIVYLATQIRNQNEESQRQAMNALTTHWSDLNRTLVENPEMAALWLRTLRSFDELDSTYWMERSTSDCGADMSGQSPTRWRIPVSNVVGHPKTLAH